MGLTRARAYQIFDIDYKQAVRVITVTNVTLSGGAPLVVDGITLNLHDRILVTGQLTSSQNGLYWVTTVGTGSNGTWERSIDGNETGEIDAGMIVMVTEGDLYEDTQWKLITDNPIIIGTTGLTFVNMSTSSAQLQSAVDNFTGDGSTVNFTLSVTPATENLTFVNINGSEQLRTTYSVTNNILTFTSAPGAGQPIEVTTLYGSASAVTEISSGTTSVSIPSSGGNINLTSSGNSTANITSTALVVTGNVSATGNISGTYFIGNGSQLTGITGSGGSNISNGTSNVTVVSSGGNVAIGVDGTSNVVVFASTGGYVTGLVSASGTITGANITGSNFLTSGLISASGTITGANITGSNFLTSGLISASATIVGGNLQTGGFISASGNITGGNVTAALLTGNVLATTISSTASITGGNLFTGGEISATGRIQGANINGANISASGSIYGTDITITGDVHSGNLKTTGLISASGNITGNNISITSYTGTVISVTANITGGNLTTGGQVTSGGNITGANLLTGGLISATGTVTGANITGANLLTGGLISATGTVTGGNIATGGTVSATANVTGGNILTGGLVSAASTITGSTLIGTVVTASGNITGGNVLTGGLVSSTGNITGGNILTSGMISASGNAFVGGYMSVAGNLYVANIVSQDQLVTTDPLVYFQSTSTYPYVYDIGFYSHFIGGTGNTYQHTGFVRDYHDNTWKLFSNVPEPAGSAVDLTNAIYDPIQTGNVLVAGIVSATGNVTGNYFIGNGSLLTGITGSGGGSNISNGTSNVTVVSSDGNIAVGVAGTSNVVVWASTGEYVTGIASVSGTVTGGNLATAGTASATGNITGGNLLTGGLVSATGNVTGGNIISGANLQLPAAGSITTTPGTNGNITVDPDGTGYLLVTSATPTVMSFPTSTTTAALQLSGAPYSAGAGTGRGLLQIGSDLTFNDTNILSSQVATANSYVQMILQNQSSGTAASADFVVNNDRVGGTAIYGDFGINSSTFAGASPFSDPDGTYVYAAGGSLSIGTNGAKDLRIATNDTLRATVTSAGLVSVVGNVQAGNLLTAGLISATGNVAAAAFNGTSLSVSGNVTGGNISVVSEIDTATLTATGNVSVGNLLTGAAGHVYDMDGDVRTVVQNSQTANPYTLTATDDGKHIYYGTSSGVISIPASIFTAGQAITVFNNTATNLTIANAAGVTLRLAGTAATGNRTLAQYGLCTTMCVAANVFVISGAGLT